MDIYSSMGKVPALGPAPHRPPDPRFVHGPSELCQLAGVWNGEPLQGDWVIEEKVDGIRMLWIGDADGGGAIITRKGDPMDCAEHLRPELERLQRRFGEPMVFDGEYAERGGFLPTLSAFRRGTGTGRFHLFDAVTVEEWNAGGGCRPLEQRRRGLAWAIDDWSPTGIVLAPQRSIVENEDIERLAQWVWDRGGEGLMLKDASAPYIRARRPTWLKVKRELALECTYLERLKDGAAARVLHEGHKLRVAVPPPLRGNHYAEGQPVTVAAMEWTDTGQLRQGRLTAGKERT